jgi:hypothetical protein
MTAIRTLAGGNASRVKEWRKNNPHYWRRPIAKRITLQDVFRHQVLAHLADRQRLTAHASQDVLLTHSHILLGVAAGLAQSPEQDHIDGTLRDLIIAGETIRKTILQGAFKFNAPQPARH